jgi:hypothetical protein
MIAQQIIGLSNRIVVMKDKVVTAQLDAPPDAKPSEAKPSSSR